MPFLSRKPPAQRRGRANTGIVGGAAADGQDGAGGTARLGIGQQLSGAEGGGLEGIAFG